MPIASGWPSIADVTDISDHQRERLSMATSKNVGILGGNPGAGKTRTGAAIIRAVLDRHAANRVAVCAPTGKAAVRITEALQRNGVSKIGATTIHRLLGVSRNGHDGDGWGFQFNTDTKLPIDYCFVDESSMIDTDLAYALASALPSGANMLWMGDFAQLPPVGHGAPLRDMIASGVVPYGELEEIWRNGGDIVKACAALKAHRPFVTSEKLDPDNGANLLHIETNRSEQVLEKLTRMLTSKCYGRHPVWDCQVICAVNEGTPVSRDALNKHLQLVLNPVKTDDDKKAVKGFRLDDKIICTSNMPGVQVVACPACASSGCEWQPLKKIYVCKHKKCEYPFAPKYMPTDFVANGEIGRVSHLVQGGGKDFIHIQFDMPRREVRVTTDMLNDFSLGYAITCHKSQGSQWPIVIIVIDDSRSADFVTSWEWHRTAISRAEWLCVTMGSMNAINRQCRKSALQPRKTFLREWMTEGISW